MSSSTPLTAAAIGVICRGPEFLVVRRSAHVRAPHLLCFPGGGIEPGESYQQAVVRELEEELAVQVDVERRVWQSRSAWDVEMHWVHCRLTAESRIRPNPQEVAEVHWLTVPQMLASEDLLPSNREFLRAMEKGLFRLKLPDDSAGN